VKRTHDIRKKKKIPFIEQTVAKGKKRKIQEPDQDEDLEESGEESNDLALGPFYCARRTQTMASLVEVRKNEALFFF